MGFRAGLGAFSLERAVSHCQVQYQRVPRASSSASAARDHLDSPAPGLHFTYSRGRAEAQVGALVLAASSTQAVPQLAFTHHYTGCEEMVRQKRETEASP